MTELSEQEMLNELTRFHPKVLQADVEIATVEQRLQTVARQIPGSPAALPEPVAPEPPDKSLVEQSPAEPPPGEAARLAPQRAELAQISRNLKSDADTAADVYRRASQTEQTAWQRHQQQPQIELVLAEATVMPVSSKPPTALLSVALAAGLAAAAGVGLLCSGATMEPTLNTIDQIEAALSVPVIGSIAAKSPSPDSSALRPLPSPLSHQVIARPILIVAGLLLITGCIAAAVWAVR